MTPVPAIRKFGWREAASAEEWLLAEPWKFGFFQAVRLLETMRSSAAPLAEAADPADEPVRFRSRVTLEYSASEVQKLEPSASAKAPPVLSVNLLGLAGVSGPLPVADTELLLERAFHGDHAMADFLDIFNHRLISLLVRSAKAAHPVLTQGDPSAGRFAQYLYSLFGMAFAEVRNRLRIPDRSLLYYSGILAARPRSASGLETLLGDYFQVPVHVRQLVGTWRKIEPSHSTMIGSTMIGASGRNNALGRTAVAGGRFWDQQGRFRIEAGPIGLEMYLNLLPNGSGFEALSEMARFYAGLDFEFGIRLILLAAEIPETRLDRNARLGWTSFLKTRGAVSNGETTLRPARTGA
jgi:type VI secretion system protein ImpH